MANGPGPGSEPDASAPGAPRVRPVQSVLFACAHNAVRSPMAERIARHYFGRTLYIQSAGVRTGEVDPFVDVVLEEIGIEGGKRHAPRSFEDLEELEGLNFDLVVTLSPEAHHKALDLTRTLSLDVEYWPTPDPTDTQGSRAQVLDAYRAVRDRLQDRILSRLRGSG